MADNIREGDTMEDTNSDWQFAAMVYIYILFKNACFSRHRRKLTRLYMSALVLYRIDDQPPRQQKGRLTEHFLVQY